MATIHVPYGAKDPLDLDLEGRNLVLDTDLPFPAEVARLDEAILATLDNPVAGPSFSKRLEDARSVVILVDNFARLTPAHRILPPIIRRIKDAGKQVAILVASGALREMSETELQRKLGAEILASGIPIYQNRAQQRWEYDFVGVTSYGTPINVHRRLLEADLSLAVTMTQATLWGYGGGGSMVLPGACSYETIEWNHRLMTCPQCAVGYEPPQNRMREDIEEAAKLAGLDMSLLAILNPRQEIIDLTAGETIEAHKASVQKYNVRYAHDVEKLPGGKLDVAISGSFAGDRFFAHSCWPIANLDPFVRDGGTIVLATPIAGGLAHYAYAREYMPPTPEAMRRLYEDLYFGKQALWHACLWFPIVQVMQHKRVIVVTEPERVEELAMVGIPAVTSMAQAYDRVLSEYGPGVRVGNFPYGKWIVTSQAGRRER